ncbi:MAG: TonB-dependent receptor [Nevskiales bacterium]
MRSLLPVILCACVVALPLRAAEPAPVGTGFNPKISLILQGTYADFSSKLEPEVAGFLLGPETELRPAGFSLGETELAIEANIDDAYHGWATVALENEDGETVVAVEEAYINTLALPSGFNVKFGRFFSDLGYLNRVHSHGWDFADQPLVYRALLANQYSDDGLQARWVAPTDVFLEFGAEVLRGDGFPGGGGDRSGVNATTLFTHWGGDLGGEGSYRAGLWMLNTDADGRETGGENAPEAFSFFGDSRLYGLDVVYKWARNGNPADRNFILQAEYIVRDEDGRLDASGVGDLDGDGVDDDVSTNYDSEADGFYVQGILQFIPRWRVGLRYDSLSADNKLSNNPLGQFDILDDSDDPERVGVMLDYSRSEFSRIRLQYNRDESRPRGEKDDQFYVQYIYSLGSHPAHQF